MSSFRSTILNEITNHFLESRDFNGIHFSPLTERIGSAPKEIVEIIEALVEDNLVGVLHQDHTINPHIIRLGLPDKQDQLDKIDADSLANACLYPTPTHLEDVVDRSEYAGQPYSLRLALGKAHLAFRSFDLSVLEHYRNDPRYYYRNDDVNGSISVGDDHFETGSMRESDEVLLKFGFSYDEDMHRAVAVFLTELASLTPEHQQIWRAKQLGDEYKLHPDFYRNMVVGDWGQKMSLFHAFALEMWLINQAADMIDRPPLFHKDFGRYPSDTPRNFGFLIRPTSKEYNDFIHLLDKLLSDNLNKKFFGDDVSDQYEDGRRKGTINMLDEWVRKFFRPVDWEPWEEAIDAIKKVRKKRQKPAHAIIENEFDQEYIGKQREIMIQAYSALRTLRMILENHPAVSREKLDVPDTIQEGRIWTF